MVARPSTPVRSGNAGEISQAAAGRVDIKQYYSAGLAYKNVEPVPQGGFRQMGGSWRIGRWRRPLAARAITGGSVTAGPHTGTQTVWTGTVAGTVAAVRVAGFDISAGTATFTVEAQVAGDWVTVGGPFAVGNPAVAESRLAAFAPGGQPSATGLRIRATFSTSSTVAISAVTAYFEDGPAIAPRFVALTADDGVAYAGFVTAGMADFFTVDGHCGAAWLPDVTQAMLPDLDFYAEANTIGVFHGALESLRIFHATEDEGADWRVDNWPFNVLPVADLGGTYPRSDDVWDVILRWTSSTSDTLILYIIVNGETTSPVRLTDSGGTGVAVGSGSADWDLFAANLEAAIEALPSLGAGVTVTKQDGDSISQRLTIRLGGALTGQEYQLSASVGNTTAISALPYHTQIGETELEPLWSSTRGWPGTADLFQDRMLHGRSPALTGALAMSEAGEYFTFNIKALGDNAARLDKIRSRTSEIILAAKESQYLLVFTNLASYFAPNRTIARNQPVNFVKASETGIQPNCRPFDLEGIDYYVAIHPKGMEFAAEGGKQLLKIVYDDVSTKYNAAPVSLLATHLVERVVRACRQRPLSDLDAAKGWLMRSDGRLVAGQFVDSQEILGFCEWIAASGGAVREIGLDGLNRLWLAVERAGSMSLELYDTAIFLQDAVAATPDLAGLVTGLPFEEGAQVWAAADGYVVGPLAVASGAVDLADSYETAIVGRWQAPRYESVPQVYVTPSDDVIWRPGRIHTLDLNLIDTTSLSVGANGEAVEEVALTRAGDPADAPPQPRTEKITVSGITGAMTGTTAVITQLRPGSLRIRDFSIGAKL